MTTKLLSHYLGEVQQLIDESKKRDDWYQWKRAMEEEMTALRENKTWIIVEGIPNGRKAINSMWTFTVKMEDDSPRYKARLVAKDCSQRPGLDYGETFAPVSKMTTIRTLLSIAVQNQLLIHQMDVKTAFLNGLLKEEIYMRLPPDEDNPPKICKLIKSLYGLKQAGRSWNMRFNEIIISLCFKNTESDTCLYICREKNLYIILYVDDILIFGRNIRDIEWIKSEFFNHFKMKDLGEVSNFLGLDIQHNDRGLTISQKSYVEKVLCRFGMQDCKPISTPIDQNARWLKTDGPGIYVQTGSMLFCERFI